jgi:hypothetical protein
MKSIAAHLVAFHLADSWENHLVCNMGWIDAAKQEWAFEQRRQDTDTPSGSDLQPYLGRTAAGSLPSCPVDGANSFATSYTPQSAGAKPMCLIIPATHILP